MLSRVRTCQPARSLSVRLMTHTVLPSPCTFHLGQEPEACSFLSFFFFWFFFVSCKVSGRTRLFLIICLLFSLLSALGLGFGRRRQCLRPGSHPLDMASRCPACPSKARSRADGQGWLAVIPRRHGSVYPLNL